MAKRLTEERVRQIVEESVRKVIAEHFLYVAHPPFLPIQPLLPPAPYRPYPYRTYEGPTCQMANSQHIN